MKRLLAALTDRVTTKRGMWITLIAWLVVTLGLFLFAPSAKDYDVSSIQTLPDDAKSVIANEELNKYFKDDQGVPALLVFSAESGKADTQTISQAMDVIIKEDIKGVKEAVPFSSLPPQAQVQFLSKDGTTAVVPLNFESSLESKEIQAGIEDIYAAVEDTTADMTFKITGPAGIAADTLGLFSKADLVLLFSTVGLILVLLIVIYRSPLLALIPLLAAGFVYIVVDQLLGIMGKAGLEMSTQSLSIMTILLFAAVIDYSLFVFARYREELKRYTSKHEAMSLAMRETGEPVFFSGGTVLAAMLVLFLAKNGDYQSFAPTFATTMFIIMIASVTLVPALFTLFGRKSFWPKVPQVGESIQTKATFWSRTANFVTTKPLMAGGIVFAILLISALNIFNIKYEFDTVKGFPEDMQSREGYEIVEEKFDKGDLAPTTVLLKSEQSISKDQSEKLAKTLEEQNLVASIRQSGATEDGKALQYSLSFSESPYALESLDALESIRDKSDKLLKDADIDGELYFAGETATKVDDRTINDRDIIVIVIAETLLILVLLFVLTRSFKMPIYMMGTILLSFLAALGLGTFLTDILFGIDAINTRVPLYAFVFLVALGIDYNIILISRYKEEREKHPVKKAVEIAVANTGGVISSAGIILAATFAVLMTQPIAVLFVFGFIVAIGIILDTFLVRGLLLPSLILFFEKDADQQKEVHSTKL
ncbi:MMPL family transporter [Bacillus sp. D386]|uniref:MMPL family transporter n=1 Tax=Bacillus sp. D386 TaxID=2587155 RepID=UPI00111F1919|nr:MMPL family transporter [Bacillus sp. D386]